MRKLIVSLLLCVLLMGSCAFGAERSGIVTRVFDGDTVMIDNAYCVRLSDVDAPEKDQPYGRESADYLAKVVLGKKVIVDSQCQDKYGRTIAHIYLQDPDMTNVSKLMVLSGYAWHYKAYAKQQPQFYDRLERDARTNRRGLWKQRNPQAPWDYRHHK